MMKLQDILAKIEVVEVNGPTTGTIKSVAYDSRQVRPNSLFVALRGEVSDGHDFIERAIEAGASAVLTERSFSSPRAACIQVVDTRRVMAEIAAMVYRNPSRHMKVAGITGTNGKTTTGFLLKHICDATMRRCGLIGTVQYEVGNRILPASRTTPESADLQELLSQMRDSSCKAAVMEVSSHALMQDRTAAIEFDVAVFTNLSQDHLDYHRTMDEYFEAKARLFDGLLRQHRKNAVAVINLDDKRGRELVARLKNKLPVVTYGVGAQAEFRAGTPRIENGKTVFELSAEGRTFLVRTPLIGRFNIYNTLAALAAATVMKINLRDAVKALVNVPQVPGRLQAIPVKRNFQVYVDYAHTPDALENVLKTVRELAPRRLIVVFGCGGDRDKEKRAQMAKVVEANASFAIVTSDNPRSEDPEAICDAIVKGFSGENFEVLLDRKDAIYRAIELVGEQDIVVIAGKGHETTQEVKGQKSVFNDCDVATWALAEKPSFFSEEEPDS